MPKSVINNYFFISENGHEFRNKCGSD